MAPESQPLLDTSYPLSTIQPQRLVRRDPAFARFYGYVVEFVPLASGAVGATQQFTVDGGIRIYQAIKLAAMADNLAAKVQVFQSPNREPLTWEPVYLTHLGSGSYPFTLPAPWLLGRNNVVTVSASDRQLVAADNNIRLALFGAKVDVKPKRPARRYTNAIPWTYPANFTAVDSGQGALTANQTKTLTAVVDSDCDFEVWKVTVASDGPVTLQFWSDDDEWFSAPIRSELLGGSSIETPVSPEASGHHPFILPMPRIIGPAEYIRVQAANQTALSNRVDIQFHGLRLFPGNGLV